MHFNCRCTRRDCARISNISVITSTAYSNAVLGYKYCKLPSKEK